MIVFLEILKQTYSTSDGIKSCVFYNLQLTLSGITSKLGYIADSGINAIWLSPIYASPMVDFGYDISNFVDVDPIFGSLQDFKDLLARAKAFGLKVRRLDIMQI